MPAAAGSGRFLSAARVSCPVLSAGPGYLRCPQTRRGRFRHDQERLEMDHAPTYYRHTLREAEFCAARLEFATGTEYVVEQVGKSRFRIRPGRLLSAVSASMSHVLQEYPDGTSAIHG